jgi:hypothetical protein
MRNRSTFFMEEVVGLASLYSLFRKKIVGVRRMHVKKRMDS